jgi:hypothetical protein
MGCRCFPIECHLLGFPAKNSNSVAVPKTNP